VFEAYTHEARQALVMALEEAKALHSTAIGTGHLLLGVIRSLPLLVPLRAEDVRARLGSGDAAEDAGLPFTDAAKRALEEAPLEAQRLGHGRVTPAHLLLALAADADQLWRQLDGSVRNQVRKAERNGLSIEFGGAEKLDAFHSIFAVRMHDLGSPVHSRGFFDAVFHSFGSRARVTIVRKGITPVGGLIALAHNDTVTVPWASCLPEYFSLCPNMLLYWTMLEQATTAGQHTFDFGRSSPGGG